MSQQYQVLARKYRSKNFHELVGQTHVSKALINAIDYNRLHHAYLFTGTRGIGKTTIARILSKCLNCETGITSTPCGICNTCMAIDAGRFIDLIEIDAASRTKVEDTRELIDNVPYAPTQGRFKVYLIDEVHMLSTHSFNALLKTLEEPPAHVKFLLATTDPQKLPITIISRCLQFVLRPLPQQAISDHLAYILTNEGVEYTESALWQLANAAKGSMRDALSLTDQAIAFGQGRLANDTVNDMLGLIDSADLISLLLAIYKGDTQVVALHIEQMRMQLVDAGSMFDGLAELLHQLAMTQLLPNIELNVNEKQAAQIVSLANEVPADVLQLYYQIVIQGREQIKLANTPLQALEMSLLRLLAFRPLAVNEIPTLTNDPNLKVQSQANVDNNNYPIDNADNTILSSHPKSQSTPQDTVIKSSLDNHCETQIVNKIRQVDTINHQSGITPSSKREDTFSQNSKGIRNHNILNLAPDASTKPTKIENTKILNSHNDKNKAEIETIGSKVLIKVIREDTDANKPLNFINEALFINNEPKLSSSLESTIDTPNLSELEKTTSTSKPAANTIIKAKGVSLDDNEHSIEHSDPRVLLQSTPIELTGNWTPEKWDFWLQSARSSGLLAQDELALARQGVMEGEVEGDSIFKVAFDTKNMNSIFKQLASHLFQQFAAKVNIVIDDSLAIENIDLLPQTRQFNREIAAKSLARELLMSSPVLLRLNESHCKITNLKLLKI